MKQRSTWMPIKESPRQLKVPITQVEKDCLPQTIAVVGAASHVGGRIVQRLLALGHFVNAVVDNDTEKGALQGLFALPGATKKLKIKKAEFSTGTGVLSCIKGCDAIMHCVSWDCCNLLSSFYNHQFDDEEQFQLLQKVLQAADYWESVKRVIITLPTSNIGGNEQQIQQKQQKYSFTEYDWNTTPSNTELVKQYAKILLEKFAWKRMRQQDGWDLVSIHLDVVFGPPISLHNKEGCSANYIEQSMKGKIFCMPQCGLGITDVRDAAAMHTSALNHKKIKSGRYMGVAENMWIYKVHDLIQQQYPQSKLPLNLPTWLAYLIGPWFGFGWDILRFCGNKMQQIGNMQARDLFLPDGFMSVEESLTDMVEYYMETGIVSLPIN